MDKKKKPILRESYSPPWTGTGFVLAYKCI